MVATTTSQVITDDLRRWIVAQAEAGCRVEDVLDAMRASGWAEDIAIDAMEQAMRQRLLEAEPSGRVESSLPEPVPVPEPGWDESRGATLRAADREVRVLLALRQPRVMLFGALLADAECDALRDLAAPRLVRSETVVNESGENAVHEARTSEGMFFERGENELVARLERRIAALVHWPIENGEGIQVLRYRPGAEYKPHHDYFDPAHAGTARILERGGQRVATIVMYLNHPEGGGATTFPDANLAVAPVQGHAVFFSYDRAHPCTRTLHGGAPVTSGEKWVATKWLREREFR